MDNKGERIETASGAEEAAQESSTRKKRSRSESEDDDDDEVERLRDKNRTNSKRFRDRKKSYMDGLFEEKYRLGKLNNDLRDDNEKIRALLEEARMENELHRQNVALGFYPVHQPHSLMLPPPALSSVMRGTNGIIRPSMLHAPTLGMARLQSPRMVLEEDLLVAARRARSLAPYLGSKGPVPSPALLNLLDEVEARKRELALEDLALRGLENSMKAKITGVKSITSSQEAPRPSLYRIL